MSGVVLHAYTVWTAYKLTTPGWLQYVAAYAAYAFPPLAEFVMIYFARRATGSWINAYSFWVLAWSVLLVIGLALSAIRRRYRH